MINRLNIYLITFFGLGRISKIPGSLTSLATVLILFFLLQILNLPANLILFLIILIFFLSLYSINVYIKEKDNKDPKEIVIDEFIGQSIPICLYEIAHTESKAISTTLTFYFIMFILFRIFDIVKPFPVSYYDKNFKNSFGVLMDDVCAGLYVVVIMVFFMIITS